MIAMYWDNEVKVQANGIRQGGNTFTDTCWSCSSEQLDLDIVSSTYKNTHLLRAILLVLSSVFMCTSLSQYAFDVHVGPWPTNVSREMSTLFQQPDYVERDKWRPHVLRDVISRDSRRRQQPIQTISTITHREKNRIIHRTDHNNQMVSASRRAL